MYSCFPRGRVQSQNLLSAFITQWANVHIPTSRKEGALVLCRPRASTYLAMRFTSQILEQPHDLLLLLVVHLQVRSLQPHLQMFIGSDGLPRHIRVRPARRPLRAVSGHMRLHPLARHRLERRGPNRVAEKCDAIPRLGVSLAIQQTTTGEHDPVHGGPQQAVGPVAQQVADVDEDWRAGVILRARGADRHGRPRPVWQVDLKAGLAPQPEEEGDAAVVGVGSRSDVLGAVAVLAQGLGRGVVEEAEDVAAGPALTEVAVAEEGGWLDL